MSSIFSAVPIDNLPDAIRCRCPNPPAPSDVIDWATASHYLNHGQWLYARTLANNTRLLRLVDGDVALRLHSSEIVVYPHPSKALITEARFSLAGYPIRTTARRIIEHTGVLNIGLTEEKPSVLSQSYVLGDKTMWMGCTDNEVMAVTGAGHVVLDIPGPMLSTDFHPKAKRPYRTRRKRGGKKQTVAHFTESGVLKPEHLYKLMDDLNQNMQAYQQQIYQQQPKPILKPPSSSQVDGERVRHTLGQAVPDMNRGVRCPEPLPDFTICRELHSLASLLVHLNDIHRWTREGIADWLEAQDLDLEFRPPPDHSPPTTYTPF